MISLITSAFDIHLNINQTVIINSSAVLFSLTKLIAASVPNHLNNSAIRFPSIFSGESVVLVRVSWIYFLNED
jgi:hypothetical protein